MLSRVMLVRAAARAVGMRSCARGRQLLPYAALARPLCVEMQIGTSSPARYRRAGEPMSEPSLATS